MVEELSSGPCVAMEIVAKNKNVNTAVEFRKLVGPSDPVSTVNNLLLYTSNWVISSATSMVNEIFENWPEMLKSILKKEFMRHPKTKSGVCTCLCTHLYKFINIFIY